MRALIAGLGSAGRRHAVNLAALLPDVRLCVLRRPGRDLRDVHEIEAFVDRVVRTAPEAITWGPDAAIVATPAPFHVEVALALVRAGVPVLVEKPLSHSMQGVGELLEASVARGVPLMVGYQLRFDPALRSLRDSIAAGRIGRILFVRAEVGQYLPVWRPGTDYRDSPSAQESLGGGALLELSHELDLVRWIGGEVTSLVASTGKVGDLDIDVEDTADLLLQLDSGALASVHMDMVQRAFVRTFRVVGASGTALWDGVARRGWILHPDGWEEPVAGAGADRNVAFVEELRHFLRCAETGDAPEPSGEDGLHALEIVLAAKRSAAEGAWVKL